jgi:hypothetical protein
VGVATFVVGNFFLLIMAYPTMPNPGPQSDIRLPLFGLVAVVLVITFLLKRAGLAFGGGFAAGLVGEMLFMGQCTAPWIDPAGTAHADAATARRVEAASAESEARARAKWIGQLRDNGLNLSAGDNQLMIAASCLYSVRKKQGWYPAPEDSLWHGIEDNCWELRRRQTGESGWRVLYSRSPGDSSAGFQLRGGPDAALRLKGPLLEIDQRGLMVRRDSAKAPAFAVGSPAFVVARVVALCITRGGSLEPRSPSGVRTLHDLIFRLESGCSRVQIDRVKEDSYVRDDLPNQANLWIPTTGPFVGIAIDDIATIWTLLYVPYGKTPADGYELQVRPLRFGDTGFRNYLLRVGKDEKEAKVYVTWEDRPATTSDSLVPACEMDPNLAC